MVSSNSDYFFFFDLTISENDNELQDDYTVIVSWQAYTSLLLSLSSVSVFFLTDDMATAPCKTGVDGCEACVRGAWKSFL